MPIIAHRKDLARPQDSLRAAWLLGGISHVLSQRTIDPYQQLRATLKLQLALSTPATPETWRTCYSYNMRQNENVIEEKMLGRIAFLLGARLSFDSCPKVEAWSC